MSTDFTSFSRRYDGDIVLMRRLAALYADEYPRQLHRLQSAMCANDALGFRRAAHTIKGTAMVYGSADLAAVAAFLEHMAVAGFVPGGPTALNSLQLELERLRKELATFLEDSPTSTPEAASAMRRPYETRAVHDA